MSHRVGDAQAYIVCRFSSKVFLALIIFQTFIAFNHLKSIYDH